MIEVLTNPRCSKCRQAIAFLESRGEVLRLRNYLEDPLSLEELRVLARRLGLPAREWMRQVVGSDQEEQLASIAANPELLQRPILVKGEQAMVARTPEALREFVKQTAL
jgi:arsenate reductase